MGCITSGSAGGTFSWTKVSGPGTVTFTSPTDQNPIFSANQAGNYTVQVEYTDNASGATATDISGTISVVNITVQITSCPDLLAKNSTATASATITPSDRTITWSIEGNALGCAINPSTGEITTGSSTEGGIVYIRAADSEFPDLYYDSDFFVFSGGGVEITLPENYPAFIEVDGELPLDCKPYFNDPKYTSYSWEKVLGPEITTFSDSGIKNPTFSAEQPEIYKVKVNNTITVNGTVIDTSNDTSGDIIFAEVTSVNSDKDNPYEYDDVEFTAIVTPSDYSALENLVVWSGGENPSATGTGKIFTTNWSAEGPKVVRASFNSSFQEKEVLVSLAQLEDVIAPGYVNLSKIQDTSELCWDCFATLDRAGAHFTELNHPSWEISPSGSVAHPGGMHPWSIGRVTGVTVPGEYTVTATFRGKSVSAKTWVYIMELNVSGVDDSEEEDPGAVIQLNDDNDDADVYVDKYDGYNGNGIPGDDDDENSQEGDLKEITINYEPTNLPGSVNIGGSSGKIRVWTGTQEVKGFLVIGSGGVGSQDLDLDAFPEVPRSFLAEGYNSGEDYLSLYHKSPEGVISSSGPPDDIVKFNVLKYDLDVDSNNNDGTGPPQRSIFEEGIENKEGEPGKYIMVNDDDDDDDGIPDFADGFNLYGGTSDAPGSSEAFIPLVLQISSHIEDIGQTKIKFTYSASDPADGVVRSGTAPDYTYTTTGGTFRIWTKNGNQSRNKASVINLGDFIGEGTYLASDLGISSAEAKTLYIEAISPGSKGDTITAEYDPDGDGPLGFIFTETVRVTAIKVDVDIDTNNNNNLERNLVEDHYEDKKNDAEGKRPGKYIEINFNDDDLDSIPDFADGFDRYTDAPGNADNTCVNEQFVSLIVEIPEPIELEKARIKVTYNANDPSSVSRGSAATPLYDYPPPTAGNLRIWTILDDGDPDRNKASAMAATPGHYVEPGIYNASQLGFEGTDRIKTFYVEGIVAQTQQISDDGRIKFEVDPDGSEGNADWVAVDKVRTMIIKSDIDIDSDNNDTIEDCDEPIEDKSPGAILPKDLAGNGTGQDYRKEIKLKIEPVIYNGQIELNAEAGVKIWTAATGGTEVSLPATYNAGSLPASLWVDGVTKGLNPGITLKYKDKNGLKVAEDKVKTFVTETISWAPAKGDVAHVWSSLPHLGTGDGTAFENQIDDQGFDVVWFSDNDDCQNVNFNDCTLANYQGMKDCGAFTVISHGGRGSHYAVYADGTIGSGDVACDNWRAGQANMSTERFVSGGILLHSVKVDSPWLSANWSATLNTNKAIAIWSICYSATAGPGGAAVKEAAGGRWRSGFCCVTTEGQATNVNNLLLGRMNGSNGAGAYRTAGEAWDTNQNGTGGDGYDAGACAGLPSCVPGGCPMYAGEGGDKNVKMDGNYWTTLCPAPMKNNDYPVWPNIDPGNRYGWGCIIFDTYMNDSISSTDALTKNSGGSTYDHKWRGNATGKYILGFDYDKTDGTETTMQAVGIKCKNKDPDGGRALDADRTKPNATSTAPENKDWTY
jgi:hypothetical protein